MAKPEDEATKSSHVDCKCGYRAVAASKPPGSMKPATPFLLGGLRCADATPTDGDRAAAQAVVTRWISLARDGQPEDPGLPAWLVDAKFKNVLLEFGDKQVERPAFMRDRLHTFIGAGYQLGP